jgi:periplasmic protein TonB
VNVHRRPSRWAPLAIGAGGIAMALLLVLVWARHAMASKPKTVREVPQIVQLIRPPPQETPPPPPPEKVEQPLPQDKPDPTPAPEQAPEHLGLDAEGTAGSDAFGLAARQGGADILGTGSAIFGHYTALLKDAIQDKLSANEKIRRGSYSAAVRIWVASDGSVERALLVQGTGKSDLDAAIETAARQVRLGETPPLEMPQPITLKIVSRG